MRNKWLKRLFPYIAFLLLIPWPVAYAFDDAGGQDGIQIAVADESVKPALTVFSKAIGSVESGELFYINASGNSADIVATIYLTNPQELIKHYSYFIFKVGVYVQTNGKWEKASGSDGSLISDAILSMKNGQITFALPGYANYMVGIDGGAFYSTNADASGSSLSPQFFLEVN